MHVLTKLMHHHQSLSTCAVNRCSGTRACFIILHCYFPIHANVYCRGAISRTAFPKFLPENRPSKPSIELSMPLVTLILGL